MSLTSVSNSFANARIPARPVGLARIVIGIVAFISGLEAIAILLQVLTPETVAFPYGAWSVQLPEQAAAPIGILWLLFATCFAAGYATRLSGFGLTATMGFVLSTDQRLYSNHFYLLALTVFFLTLADSGAARSIDARRGRTRTTVPAWPVLLLKIQFTIVYLFAALSKINSDYLTGDFVSTFFHLDRIPFLPTSIQTPELFKALAICSIAIELFLTCALWSARWRKVGLATAIVFHGSIVVIMDGGNLLDLTVFSSMMICIYTLFCALPLTILGNNLKTTLSVSPLTNWPEQRQSFDPAAD